MGFGGIFKRIGNLLRTRRQTVFRSALVVAAACGAYTGLALWSERNADRLLAKGFGTLAADSMRPYRMLLSHRMQGCRMLISAYFQARDTEQLDRVSQTCLENGVNIPEPYIGLGAVREFTGRDQDALQLLAQVLPNFEKVPDIHLRMGIILRRLKNVDPAIQAYARAAETAPANAQLQVDTLAFMAEQNRWKDALPVANRLRETQTENAEVKLLVARALAKNGDQGSAQMLAEQANGLMSKLQAQAKDYLDRNYADVLALAAKKGDAMPAAAGGDGKSQRGHEASSANRKIASQPDTKKK